MKAAQVVFFAIAIMWGPLEAFPDCTLKTAVGPEVQTEFQAASYQISSLKCQLSESFSSGRFWISIRRFKTKTGQYDILVDPKSLKTALVETRCLKNCSPFLFRKESPVENYYQALTVMDRAPFKISGFGADHEFNHLNKMYLTIDLCPSRRALVRELFENIQAGSGPVPVALSLAGSWLRHHAEDFRYLRELEEQRQIAITWINHSYTHPFDPTIPLEQNFILKEGVNFKTEVIENEKLFIRNGILPTVFFRFPGLISSKESVQSLSQWGLLPIGADAWLSLNQKPTKGSIILVHGNGNDLVGLKDLFELLKKDPTIKSAFTEINKVFYFDKTK